MNSDDLIRQLKLTPLPGEGGYFRRTHAGENDATGRAGFSVIYYLLNREQSRSRLHFLPIAETYHFYLGDPVQMLILEAGKPGRELILGQDVMAGQQVQMQVPANCWHGSRLCPGGDFALFGTTMTPGFMDKDFKLANAKSLQNQFPQFAAEIAKLTG
ncbi:hypothetical protein MNBD_ALPHA06-672 [hydrothermal vent metagenome]|uniref:DUF985 domain-containing protein n=1 Tax=hydrothermal vent metagenome TaxID=652676 RepID=A0A3B0RWE6_9ZZZZ